MVRLQEISLDAANAETNQVNTTDLASGLYFVTFTDMQGIVHYEKVVLQ